jgi:putative transposase
VFPAGQRPPERGTEVKKARFSEEQIVGILKQHEAGMKTADVCRQHNLSAATFYAWKAMYGGLEVNEAQELKRLKEEKPKLKRVVADLTLDNVVLKDLLSKNS